MSTRRGAEGGAAAVNSRITLSEKGREWIVDVHGSGAG